MINLVNELNMRFCNINPLLESTFTILNLLQKKYDKKFYLYRILHLCTFKTPI